MKFKYDTKSGTRSKVWSIVCGTFFGWLVKIGYNPYPSAQCESFDETKYTNINRCSRFYEMTWHYPKVQIWIFEILGNDLALCLIMLLSLSALEQYLTTVVFDFCLGNHSSEGQCVATCLSLRSGSCCWTKFTLCDNNLSLIC